MFFDAPPHDVAPLHNKGLSYGASYGFCHAKLLHRKLTRLSFSAIGPLPIKSCRFVMHQLCITNLKAGPALESLLYRGASVYGSNGKIEVKE